MENQKRYKEEQQEKEIVAIEKSEENQLWIRDAKLKQSCFDLKCWHDILDIISLIVDSFSSWTPMRGMIPSNLLDSFVGNFLVKKVEGHEFKDEFFQRSGEWYGRDRHENKESFQGLVTRLGTRKIDLETQRKQNSGGKNFKNRSNTSSALVAEVKLEFALAKMVEQTPQIGKQAGKDFQKSVKQSSRTFPGLAITTRPVGLVRAKQSQQFFQQAPQPS
ncbi:hypothetical protein M9H77_23449 [Catharanthus roseus]|uniref:Uncharacterized protein n=1 Tax=Catharanthus roseus TaxID=4058 RepID=A0ACC0AXD6_CATRO|nr:hypothetical protein M9H77_23449 [Catharanthus roseus]